MMNRTESYLVKKMFNKTLAIQMVASIIGVLGMVVDGVVTGILLPVQCMSAYGIAGPLITCFAAVSIFIGIGTSTLAGQLLGKGQVKDASAGISVSIAFTVIFSLFLSVLIYFTATGMAYILGADDVLVVETANYIRGFAFSLPFMILVNVFMPVMQFDNAGNRVFTAIFLMTATNILLDVLNGLVFKQGLLGMALATTASYVVAFLVMFLHFFSRKKVIQLSFRNLRWGFVPEILKMGFPRFVSLMCNSLAVVCINKIFMTSRYPSAVAVLAMITSGGQLCMIAVQGIASTVQMISSVFAGEEDIESLKDLLKCGFKKTVSINVVIIVLTIVFAREFSGCFFSGQPDMIDMASEAIRLYVLMLIPYGFAQVITGYMQGMKMYKMSLFLAVMGTFVLEVSCVFVMLKISGIVYVWSGYALAFILLLVIYYVIVSCKSKTFRFSIENIMLLNDNFGIKAENRMDCSVRTIDEVIAVSQAGVEFCLNHNGSRETATLIGLTVEEMAGNVVEHGFEEGKNNHIDIRIGFKNDEWILRIKDNCPKYDPTKYYEMFKAESPEEHIGIRMISGVAKEMRYIYALNINTLTVRI